MFLDAFDRYLSLCMEFYLKMVEVVFIVPRSRFDSEMGDLLDYYPYAIVDVEYSGLFTLTLLSLTVCLYYTIRRRVKTSPKGA